MVAKRFRVPEVKPVDASLSGFLMSEEGPSKRVTEAVQNGTFTGPILGLGRVEKLGFS